MAQRALDGAGDVVLAFVCRRDAPEAAATGAWRAMAASLDAVATGTVREQLWRAVHAELDERAVRDVAARGRMSMVHALTVSAWLADVRARLPRFAQVLAVCKLRDKTVLVLDAAARAAVCPLLSTDELAAVVRMYVLDAEIGETLPARVYTQLAALHEPPAVALGLEAGMPAYETAPLLLACERALPAVLDAHMRA
jgi:hypothetical protein